MFIAQNIFSLNIKGLIVLVDVAKAKMKDFEIRQNFQGKLDIDSLQRYAQKTLKRKKKLLTNQLKGGK